jgi:DNA-binding transcriptional ArsR family regulator
MPEDDLRTELTDVRERLARLEARAFPPDEKPNPLAEVVDEDFAKTPEEERRYPIGLVRALSYFRIHRPSDDEYAKSASDRTIGFDVLLALPADAVAGSLAGLAHPARIAIYKALLTGSKDSTSLLEVAGLNTTGQLYHHLREMEDVGLVVRRGRNLWASANLEAFAIALVAAQYLMHWRGEGKEESL